jgi:hypothetical protein
MGRKCKLHGKYGEMYTKCWSKDMEDLGIDERIILKWVLKELSRRL